jgi:hypothetical protein
MRIAAIVIVLLLLGVVAYVRFAPSDPARWHIDIAAPGFVPPNGWASFCPSPGSRDYTTFTSADPLQTLADIVDSWPRTTRLAGSVEEGRITWVTRSRILFFPDYATAARIETPDGPRVCIVSRQRFGREDMDVNATKLRLWLMRAFGADEPPVLAWRP